MSAEMMVAVVAMVAAMAFAMGYAIGGSETQEDAAPSETKEEVSANVRLILEAERARKEAAEANLHLEIALAKNKVIVDAGSWEAQGVKEALGMLYVLRWLRLWSGPICPSGVGRRLSAWHSWKRRLLYDPT